MALEKEITEIQLLYPRIYMACHTEHVRAASNEAKLSSRDSAILAHLSVEELTNPTKLAKHLKITLSTISEATAKLEELGYVKAERDQNDERRQKLRLTARGLDAMKKSSVLDSEKVGQLLSRLSPEERKKAVEGMGLLARAAIE